jgi:hypothetical protein
MKNANVSLVQSLYDAFQRGDTKTITAALTPDIVWTLNGRQSDYPILGARKGVKEVETFFKFLSENEDFSEFQPMEFYTDGDRVFALGHYAGKIKKTGRSFSTDWIHVFLIKGGKVASFKEFLDTAQFAGAHKG